MTEENIKKLEEYFRHTYDKKFDAITAWNENVLLSAGAGCGKTLALSQRVLYEVLAKGLSVNDMLILTFTEKAAGEMRDRIKKVLAETAEDHERFSYLSEDDRARLRSESEKTDTAAISTFDAFTRSIVVKYAAELKVSPQFNNLDQEVENFLFKHFAAETIDEEAKTASTAEPVHPYGLDEALDHLKALDVTDFNEVLSALYRFSSITPDYETIVRDSLKRMVTRPYLEEMYRRLNDYFFETLRKFEIQFSRFSGLGITGFCRNDGDIENCDFFEALCDKFESYKAQYEIDEASKDPSNTCFYSDYFKKLMGLIESISFSGSKNLKENLCLCPEGKSWKDNIEDSLIGFKLSPKKMVSDLIENFKKKKKSFARFIESKDVENRLKESSEFLSYSFDVYLKVKAKLDKKKTEANSLSFSDVAQKAIGLLESREDIREAERFRIKSIMVDEYQDSDDKQEKILEILGTKEEDYRLYRQDNDKSHLFSRNILFMVGDVKQSIYRFRNANPDLFQRKYREFEKKSGGNGKTRNRLLSMTDNYRSCAGVLNPVNDFFKQVMTVDLGDIDYADDPKQHIAVGCEKFALGDKTIDSYPSLYTFSKKSLEDNKIETTADTIKAVIGLKIADIIESLMKAKVQVPLRNGRNVPLKYGSFTILVEKIKDAQIYAAALKAKNIPCSFSLHQMIGGEETVVASSSLFILAHCWYKLRHGSVPLSQSEILLIKHKLASVDRSFYMDVGDIEVFKDQEWLDVFIRQTLLKRGFEKPEPSEKVFDDTEMDAWLENAPKTIKVLEKIGEKRDETNTSPIEMFDLLTQSFSVLPNIDRLDGQEVKYSAFIWLSNKIAALSGMGFDYDDICEFMGTIDETSRSAEIKPNTVESDSVSLTTMHSSKGLEYPIVFLPEPFSGQKTGQKDLIGFDRELGLYEAGRIGVDDEGKPQYVNFGRQETLLGFILLNEESKKDASERVRLLYVAMTRAVNHNFIVAYDKGPTSDPSKIPLNTADVLSRGISAFKGIYASFKPSAEATPLTYSQFEKQHNKIADLAKYSDGSIQIKEGESLNPDLVFGKKRVYQTASIGTHGLADYSFELFGDRLHKELQALDWSAFPAKSPDTSFIEDAKERRLISAFINQKVIAELKDKKELSIKQEFVYEDPESSTSGSMDFAAVYQDGAIIIDYKTKEIDKEGYVRQLLTYRRNLARIFDLPESSIRCFLYSILDCRMKEVD